MSPPVPPAAPTAAAPTAINEIRFPIRFAETDQAGVFHHSNVFVWFEMGRFELMRRLTGGETELRLRRGPIFVPVVKTRVLFKSFGRFGDELRLLTFLKPQETTKLVFYYRLLQVDGDALVALGTTEHVALTPDHRFLFRWPEWLLIRMRRFFRDHPEVLTDGGEFDAKL